MNYTISNFPTANITVRRNKIKMYGENVYLKDKQEFEIELFNPTSITKLAKISINGKLISNAGIVIKPGQRLYLERFLDVSKKFIFETYITDGSVEATNAILNNGNIVVDFYDEYNAHYSSTTSPYPVFTTYSYPVFTSNITTVQCSDTTTSLKGNISKENGLSFITEDKETGRVEQGSSSNQNLINYQGSFNIFTCNVIKIKIFPISEKPLEVRDLATYCTNCGMKQKNNWNFCAKCGTENK